MAAPPGPIIDGWGAATWLAPELNSVERFWLHLCERFLSHRRLDDCDAIVDACWVAWNRFTPERFRSVCNYSCIQQVNC